jgi:hypothetical protein
MSKIDEATFGDFPFAFHQVIFPAPGAEATMAAVDVAGVQWRAQLAPTGAEPARVVVRGKPRSAERWPSPLTGVS